MTCTRIGICLLLALGVAGPAGAQSNAPAKKGTVEKISVHGAALQGNLEGDSPDRDVFIYLPPSYASNRNQRYPVVYLLHGASITAERWMTRTNMAAAADKDIVAGTMKEMILVMEPGKARDALIDRYQSMSTVEKMEFEGSTCYKLRLVLLGEDRSLNPGGRLRLHRAKRRPDACQRKRASGGVRAGSG